MRRGAAGSSAAQGPARLLTAQPPRNKLLGLPFRHHTIPWCGSMNRSEGLPSAEGEEARLQKILADCMEAVTAARRALHEPSHSLLTPEYTKLANDLEMARAGGRRQK